MKRALKLRLTCSALGSDYWRFFAAAFVFDLGTGLFIFLLSLYLTSRGFDELSIGKFMAALTLGNLVGTLPATMIARRYGLRVLLLACFVCSPIAAVARIFVLFPALQMVLAFAQGVSLCAWPICFAPTVAKLAPEEHRSTGFSFVFATGIGMGVVAGLAGGWAPSQLLAHGLAPNPARAMQWVLLTACILVVTGAWPIASLNLGGKLEPAATRSRLVHPFLWKFLPSFLLWNVATGSFPIFGAIYLQKALGLSLGRVGTVFSAAQLAQCMAVLASPLLFRRAGLPRGVAMALFAAALCAAVLGGAGNVTLALSLYIVYSACLFLCGPGIYNLLMNRVPENERSTASAIQNASGAIFQAASAALTGLAIVHEGYRFVLAGNACVAACAGVLFIVLGAQVKQTDRPLETATHVARLEEVQI